MVTGATARLALALLLQGDLDRAQELAAEALASSGESFMPVVNGYTFKSAGLVNLALGHTAEGRAHLYKAIEAFGRGTGNLGTGQAALCWIDLSRSYRETDDADDSHRSSVFAVEVAQASADPWVQRQAEAERVRQVARGGEPFRV